MRYEAITVLTRGNAWLGAAGSAAVISASSVVTASASACVRWPALLEVFAYPVTETPARRPGARQEGESPMKALSRECLPAGLELSWCAPLGGLAPSTLEPLQTLNCRDLRGRRCGVSW